MNDDQFVNWTHQHPLRLIYNSQKGSEQNCDCVKDASPLKIPYL